MKHLNLDPDLYAYLLDISLREHPVLLELRQETSALELAHMQIPPEQAQLMQFLLRLSKASDVLEIGTFTGYSALAMSLALGQEGRVTTIDRSKEWTKRCAYFWNKAQQDHKIQLKIGRALDILNQMLEEGLTHSFDFVFIDADKTNYVNYYHLSKKLLKPQGFILIDNVFWDRKVINPESNDGQTRGIRELNLIIQADLDVEVSLLPMADGLFLVHKIR